MTIAEAMSATGLLGIAVTFILAVVAGGFWTVEPGDTSRVTKILAGASAISGLLTVGFFLASIWTQVG